VFVRRLTARAAVVLWLAAVALPAAARAQHEHIDIYSSEPGGGSLVFDWDTQKQIHVFETICAAGLCLYSTINPAFLAPTEDDAERSLYALADGTTVRVEIIDADDALALSVDGMRLDDAGESALLGTAPGIHNHPSWQVVLPEGQIRELSISYKFTADGYGESAPLTSVVSNEPQAVPTPCPAVPCGADCDGNGDPAPAEIAEVVQIALDGGGVDRCFAGDLSGDGLVFVDEIIASVAGGLEGCPQPLPPTLSDIQTSIFSPRCALPTCHDAASASGSLVLTSGVSHGELVGVPPDVAAAADAGLLRVAAGDPDLSFLYHKLVGPRPEWGSRMPLNLPCLPPEQIDQIRRWIENGAPAE
jgi:hypothetical protein